MKIEIEMACSAPCETEVFRINDVEATLDDFGRGRDKDPEHAEEYGCGDWTFSAFEDFSFDREDELIKKYDLTGFKELDALCKFLEYFCSCGRCGWCI